MKFSETFGNPVWVAEHMRELREIFPANWEPLSTDWIMHFGAKFSELRFDIEPQAKPIFNDILAILESAGVIELNRFFLRRKPVASFEIAAAQRAALDVLEKEPDDDVKGLADTFLGKYLKPHD